MQRFDLNLFIIMYITLENRFNILTPIVFLPCIKGSWGNETFSMICANLWVFERNFDFFLGLTGRERFMLYCDTQDSSEIYKVQYLLKEFVLFSKICMRWKVFDDFMMSKQLMHIEIVTVRKSFENESVPCFQKYTNLCSPNETKRAHPFSLNLSIACT